MTPEVTKTLLNKIIWNNVDSVGEIHINIIIKQKMLYNCIPFLKWQSLSLIIFFRGKAEAIIFVT
jgi:hypothetical protein